MSYDRNEFIQRLAQDNPVDLEKLAFVEQQLQQLQQVGVIRRSEYSIQRPLGRLVQIGSLGTLANVGGLTQR